MTVYQIKDDQTMNLTTAEQIVTSSVKTSEYEDITIQVMNEDTTYDCYTDIYGSILATPTAYASGANDYKYWTLIGRLTVGEGESQLLVIPMNFTHLAVAVSAEHNDFAVNKYHFVMAGRKPTQG